MLRALAYIALCAAAFVAGAPGEPLAHNIPIEKWRGRMPSLAGIGYHPAHGGLLFLALHEGRALVVHSLRSGRQVRIMGNGTAPGGCLAEPATLSPRSHLQNPAGLAVLSDEQVLFLDRMAAPRLLWAGVGDMARLAQPRSAVGGGADDDFVVRAELVTGNASCSFTQPTFTAGALAGRPMPPAETVAYRAATQQIFYGIYDAVAVAKDAAAELYFGAPGASFNATADSRDGQRLATRTGIVGDMVVDEVGGALYVAEGATSGVRRIDLATGVASVLVGPAAFDGRFHIPACPRSAPCPAGNLSLWGPKGLALHTDRATGHRSLFIADATIGVIYRMDLARRTVVAFVGAPPTFAHAAAASGRAFAAMAAEVVAWTTSQQFGTFRSIAVSDGYLYVAATGVWRFDATDVPPRALPPTPADPTGLCTNAKHCSGHAVLAVGLPMTGCSCVCKKDWAGSACAERPAGWVRSATLPATATKTLQLPEVPEPVLIPPVVIETTTTVLVTTTIALAIVTPVMAVQATRSTLLLKISGCETQLGEELAWVESVTKAELGDGPLRFFAGSVAGNIAVLVGCVVAHYAAVRLHFRCIAAPGAVLRDSKRALRFPAVASFPFFLLLDGTVRSAVALLRHGGGLPTPLIVGSVGLAAIAALTAAIAFLLVVKLRARFFTWDELEAEAEAATARAVAVAGSTESSVVSLEQALLGTPVEHASTLNNESRSTDPSFVSVDNPTLTASGLNGGLANNKSTKWARMLELRTAVGVKRLALLAWKWWDASSGEWRDDRNHHTKRYGGLFMDYRRGWHAFALVEIAMCMATGFLNGVKAPGPHCHWVLFAVAAVFVAFFIIVAAGKPFAAPKDKMVGLTIASMQALAAVLLYAAEVSRNMTFAAVSQLVVVACIMLLTLIILCDMIAHALVVGKYLYNRCKKKYRRAAGDAGATPQSVDSAFSNFSMATLGFSFFAPPAVPMPKPAEPAAAAAAPNADGLSGPTMVAPEKQDESSGADADGATRPRAADPFAHVSFTEENATPPTIVIEDDDDGDGADKPQTHAQRRAGQLKHERLRAELEHMMKHGPNAAAVPMPRVGSNTSFSTASTVQSTLGSLSRRSGPSSSSFSSQRPGSHSNGSTAPSSQQVSFASPPSRGRLTASFAPGSHTSSSSGAASGQPSNESLSGASFAARHTQERVRAAATAAVRGRSDSSIDSDL
jgi:hypothetical protein